MDVERLVYQAWRDLRESDATFRLLPVLPPLETYQDVCHAARMAILIDAVPDGGWLQLPLFGD